MERKRKGKMSVGDGVAVAVGVGVEGGDVVPGPDWKSAGVGIRSRVLFANQAVCAHPKEGAVLIESSSCLTEAEVV